MSLKKAVVSGVKWTAINRYVSKAISVGTFIVLARILQPKAFGLYAMAFLFINGFNIFKNFGLNGALIQRRDNFEEATYTGFFIFPITGVIVFLALYFSAPTASIWFDEPRLTAVLRTLGLVFLIGSFGNIPQVLLTKNMRFREIAIRDLISEIFFSATAIVLAYAQFGIWSLVYAYVFQRIVNVSLMWVIVRFRPRLVFNKRIALELLNFGKYLLGSSIIMFLVHSLDKIVIGRMLDATSLGFYVLAFNIASITRTHFTGLIGQVMYPAYAKMQRDKNDIKRIYLKTIKNVSLICIPFGVGLILLAPEFVSIVYGEKWLPMVPVLKVLAIYSAAIPLFFRMGSVFKACGKPQWDFNLNLLSIVTLLATIIPLGKFFGLIGVGMAVIFSELVLFPIRITLAKKLINLKIKHIYLAARTPLIASLVMAALITVLKKAPAIVMVKNLFFSLFVQTVLLASLAYFLILFLIDRKFIFETKDLILNRK